MVMMAGMLEGHVGGDHLAGHASSIVEGVVGHSILCPASGLADNKRISEYHQFHVCVYNAGVSMPAVYKVLIELGHCLYKSIN